MDDSCAVCAETLQWVAYGPCGHQEVCSMCVVRLRFICEDRRCCLCKSESGIIFITKALGDFTRMINDFTIFPADPREGQVGAYWYHEGTQAYFDDVDHYKMIKAMCRLSCSVCDKINERSEGSKRKPDFKNVELLKSHLAQRHRLSICSLCLEGRKVFICEQKLYSKAQLDQHIRTGDSVVDGSETERGGFMGHPMCQFCEKPFYGENELYTHMSTEHYTCHICQRQHPGQYEYFKNYDDLEIHFRHAHFLCEDEGCLEKKFVVFANGSEMKRHNAMEHGGRISRCKRSAALQIPVSFQYRQSYHQDRRGRGHRFPSDLVGNLHSPAIQAASEASSAASAHDFSSNAGAVSYHRHTSEFESVGSFELLTTMESESSSIYSHALRQNSTTALLEESSFPPLPAAPSRGKKNTRNVLERLGGNSNTSQAWSTPNGPANSLVCSFPQLRPFTNSGLLPSSSSPHLLHSRSASNIHSSPLNESNVSVRQVKSHDSSSSGCGTDSSSRKLTTNGIVSHSSSAPNLVGRRSFDDSISNFPLISVARSNASTSGHTPPKAKDVNAANKSLVERIHLALEYDKNKYAAFKELSSQYRHGIISTEEYLAFVCQFGLSHLVLELARLCPDPEKQRELVETYNFNTTNCNSRENDLNNESCRSKSKRSSKKGKEKCEENDISGSKDILADNIINSMKKLESNYKNLLDRADVLSKHGHQSAKGKSKIVIDTEQNNLDSVHELRMERLSQNGFRSTGGDSSNTNVGTGGGGNKQRKKTSKFLRNRIGNDAAALSELGSSEAASDLNEGKIEEDKDPPAGLPVTGVWRNGGGQRLVTMTQRDRRKR